MTAGARKLYVNVPVQDRRTQSAKHKRIDDGMTWVLSMQALKVGR
jgi:hypothetical protein